MRWLIGRAGVVAEKLGDSNRDRDGFGEQSTSAIVPDIRERRLAGAWLDQLRHVVVRHRRPLVRHAVTSSSNLHDMPPSPLQALTNCGRQFGATIFSVARPGVVVDNRETKTVAPLQTTRGRAGVPGAAGPRSQA